MSSLVPAPAGPRTCAGCGKPAADAARFCGGCGAELPTTPPAAGTACAHCGTRSAAGQRFCRGCGSALAAPPDTFPETIEDDVPAPAPPAPVEVAEREPRIVAVPALAPGAQRYEGAIDADLVRPAGRSHEVRLPAGTPEHGRFGVKVTALAETTEDGVVTLFEGLGSVVLGPDRLVGLVVMGATARGPFMEDRGMVLVFDLPYALVEGAEVRPRGRDAGVLLTSPLRPHGLHLEVTRGRQQDLLDALAPHLVAAGLHDAATPPPASAPAPRGSGRGRIALLVALALVTGAVVAAAAALTLTGDDAPARRAQDATVTQTVPNPGPGTTPAPPPVDGAFPAGRWVKLGSFRRTPRAQEEAVRLQGEGIDARVFSSNEIRGLLPGFRVVLAGPYDAAEARRVVRRADRAGVSGASAAELRRVTGTVDVAALAGTWTGAVRQVSRARTKTIDVRVELGADGTGRIAYLGSPDCTADLRLFSDAGTAAVYDETVTSGRCTDGGRWTIRRDDEQRLLMTWWHRDSTTFVLGTLG